LLVTTLAGNTTLHRHLRIAIAASVLAAVLCAAMTGITYAVVALSKESRVGDTGVMVVKGSDTPVSTGGAAAASGS
jgi:hypothetical protein